MNNRVGNNGIALIIIKILIFNSTTSTNIDFNKMCSRNYFFLFENTLIV